jgi:uncharacterized membrane protein
VFYHFILYGFCGWIVEVLFTGFHSAIIEGDIKATGKTYLYMHPIYGIACLGFEWFRYLLVLASFPLVARIFVYLVVIYFTEYVSGWLLKKITGNCPWEYTGKKWAIHGLIRLDYAPFWFILCFFIEPMQAWLSKMLCE